MSDETRRRILERRARFVAAALASAALGASCGRGSAPAIQKLPEEADGAIARPDADDAAPEGGPVEADVGPYDVGSGAQGDAASDARSGGTPRPRPCLSPVRKCLSFYKPKP